jgi:hypothetical protein
MASEHGNDSKFRLTVTCGSNLLTLTEQKLSPSRKVHVQSRLKSAILSPYIPVYAAEHPIRKIPTTISSVHAQPNVKFTHGHTPYTIKCISNQ